MADGVKLTDADLERLGPAAREQVRAATGSSSSDDDGGSSTSSSPTSTRTRARSRGRRRRRVRVPAAARRPARTLVRRGSTLFVGAVALTVAYWALNNPAAVSVVLRAPVTAIRWLTDPTRSIRYATQGG